MLLVSDPVSSFPNPLIVGAMSAAVELSIALDAVADDSTPTVKARWRESLNSTLKRVEGVTVSLNDYVEALVVTVVTNDTNSHP